MEHNLKFNKKLRKKLEEYGVNKYPYFDNYNALEVPFSECIPSDYDGIMGVPISFLDKYNPEQFELLGVSKAGSDLMTRNYADYIGVKPNGKLNGRKGSTLGNCPALLKDDGVHDVYVGPNGERIQATYHRIFIRPKKGGKIE